MARVESNLEALMSMAGGDTNLEALLRKFYEDRVLPELSRRARIESNIESNTEAWKRKVSPVDLRIPDDRRSLLVFEPKSGCFIIRSFDRDGNVKMEFQLELPTPSIYHVSYSIDVPFVMIKSTKIYLFDPSTQELVVLPDHNLSIDPDGCRDMLDIAAGIGYVPTTKEFKVVSVLNLCCCVHGVECAIEPPSCEVLTVGTNNWRKVPSPPFFVHPRPVSIKGVVYFFPFHEHVVENRLLSFDLEREEWSELSLPQAFLDSTHDNESYILAELKGLLCLVVMGPIVDNVRTRIQLWLLKDVENLEWVKEYCFEVDRNVTYIYAVDYVEPLDIEDDGRILMFYNSHKELFHYDPTDKSTKTFRRGVARAGFYMDNSTC